MRKWKDDGSHIIKPFQRKLYFIIGCIFLIRPVISIIAYHSLDFGDMLWGGSGILLIWGVKFNGFYKIARLYTEWKIRKNNKFDYFSR